MDFRDLYIKLKNKNRQDLIDPIEDFRDVFIERSAQINGALTLREVLDFIKRDRELVRLAKRIPGEGNLRKTAVNLTIREFSRQ